MFSVLSKRRILMLHEEAQGNPDMTRHTTILDHNIQSTTQGMIHLGLLCRQAPLSCDRQCFLREEDH